MPSKIQELREKNPEFMVDLIGDLSKRDPSGNNKYLPFMVKTSKQAVGDYFASGKYMDDVFIQLTQLVDEFDKYCRLNLIGNKDIYSYNDLMQIEAAVLEAREQNTVRDVKVGQTIVLYENANIILVKCLTEKSAKLYGKNTKWCTSAERDNRFKDYATEGTLLYLIFKNPPTELPEEWRKVAFNLRKPTDSHTVWNARSVQISAFDAFKLFEYLGKEILDIVYTEMQLCIPNSCLTKNDDEKIILNKNLFDKSLNKERQFAIEKYIASLTDKRMKRAVTLNEEYDNQMRDFSNDASDEVMADIGGDEAAIEPPIPLERRPMIVGERATNDAYVLRNNDAANIVERRYDDGGTIANNVEVPREEERLSELLDDSGDDMDDIMLKSAPEPNLYNDGRMIYDTAGEGRVSYQCTGGESPQL